MRHVEHYFSKQTMTDEDKHFFVKLGQRVAALRNEQDLTQVRLAELLGISQQHMASFEGGRRKIPANLLPRLAQLFGITVDELLGVSGKPPQKRGPASKLQMQVEQISRLPKSKQRFVIEMLDTVIQQAS
jgi:transcriptional regulator with XRE-family HTH domain